MDFEILIVFSLFVCLISLYVLLKQQSACSTETHKPAEIYIISCSKSRLCGQYLRPPLEHFE